MSVFTLLDLRADTVILLHDWGWRAVGDGRVLERQEREGRGGADRCVIAVGCATDGG
ncbi:hypothetical protein [Streptomyces netropsis]|uniref:Uncharacterized protein n=1 Tax=Streptomyces netropsis TaxID=55404 RepID=A0A7W7LDZ4_STRNE|nr:hypothetical protein [Streptomyces netropsis]MBB4887881.1 hypothetical protein [Streptomyces netropsis]